MDTPGNLLRSEREKQKKSLEDIEKALKISIEYLRAIEKDNYELLPADLFTKSYLRSYSTTLGLESDHILDLYNKQFGTPTAKEPEPPKKQPRKTLPPFKFNYIYLLAICIGLVTISVITYTKYHTRGALMPLYTARPDIDAEKNETGTAPAEESVPAEDLSLKITASELTWVSIKIDSTSPEELLLRAGESTTVTAHEQFVLKIGNAGGTSLTLNGTDIGDLGPHGQLVDITLP
jgi:cytoskeletal protein RodZ